MGKHGENIRKRKDGRWEARLISAYDLCGKAVYRSFYGKTYLEAKEKRNNYLRNSSENRRGIDTSPPNSLKITVKQAMGEWMEFRKDSVKESTFAHYTNLLDRHIFPALGSVYLSALTEDMINAFLKEQLNAGRIDGKGGLSSKPCPISVLCCCSDWSTPASSDIPVRRNQKFFHQDPVLLLKGY